MQNTDNQLLKEAFKTKDSFSQFMVSKNGGQCSAGLVTFF